MPELEGGGGPSIADMMNRGQMGGGGGGEGGGGDAPGSIIDAILRKFGINGHSSGGLATLFGDLPGIFSGLSLQAGSLMGKLDARGGVLTSFFADLGFSFGGSVHGDVTGGLQSNDVDTSGSASSDGGSAPSAASIAIPQIEMPIISAGSAANIQAPSTARASSASASMEM